MIYLNYIINYLRVLVIPAIVILVFPLFLGILNLFGLRTHSILVLIIMIITSLISGVTIGKKAIKKGYVHGLILGFIMVGLMFILGLFSSTNYNFNSFIYYLIIVVASIIGSMFGIQLKPAEEKNTSS